MVKKNDYLKNLKKSKIKNKCERSKSYLKGLIIKKVKVKSNIFYEWISIQRDQKQMETPDVMFDIINKLNYFDRPPIGLLCKIITTYCTLAIIKREYCEYALKVYNDLIHEYNYISNNYIFNAILLMLQKLDKRKKFWDLISEAFICKNIQFDGFTFGCIMHMCKIEKNYQKMRSFYIMFKSLENHLKFKEKHIEYVENLNSEIIFLEAKQREKNFYDELLNNFVY